MTFTEAELVGLLAAAVETGWQTCVDQARAALSDEAATAFAEARTEAEEGHARGLRDASRGLGRVDIASDGRADRIFEDYSKTWTWSAEDGEHGEVLDSWLQQAKAIVMNRFKEPAA